MNYLKLTMTAIAAAALYAPAALAQDAVTIEVEKGETYGEHLTDESGRAVYLFTADNQGQGETEPVVNCDAKCMEAWPPVYSAQDPKAGQEVDKSMLSRTEHEGRQIVTYNGWPLYYFVKDKGNETPTGQDIHSFDGEWYLVTPAGTKVEAEK